MALRCLASMDIDETTYPLMQLSDLSFISDSYITETQVSVSGTVTNNTDFASVHSDVIVETFYDTSLCPFTKFVRDLDSSNLKRIRIVSKENEQQSYYGICYSTLPTSDNCKVYWAFVVDDITHKGYKVIKENRLGNDLYYTQYDTRYYYAFTGLLNGGGAGSGYIGNSLLSNKKMVGYNVPTSSAESTKTESVNEASATPVSGKPKSGNGFAKIKFLREAWGGEEVPILWAGNSNKMTVQISNSNILFKLYTGDSVIYSFTAYAGSTIYDADNIYVGFLIDAEQELAKPSMVYTNGSVLSYNQEEPTDAEMGDIYTWLSAGLPSE